MSVIVKKIMIRVIRDKMVSGETLEDILLGYPKLTEEEKEELRIAVA